MSSKIGVVDCHDVSLAKTLFRVKFVPLKHFLIFNILTQTIKNYPKNNSQINFLNKILL